MNLSILMSDGVIDFNILITHTLLLTSVIDFKVIPAQIEINNLELKFQFGYKVVKTQKMSNKKKMFNESNSYRLLI